MSFNTTIRAIILFCGLFVFLVTGRAQNEPSELLKKAQELKKLKKCPEALILLDKALSLQPDYPDALLEKGWCLNELNRPAEAVSILTKALEGSDNKQNVYYELGHAWFYLDKKDSAFRYFTETLKLNKDHQLAAIGMADIYREKFGNTREALNWYLKAYRSDSSHKKTNYWTGWCYNDLKLFDSAAFYLQKVLNDEPSSSLAAVELGYAYYSLGRYNEAIAAFKGALQQKNKPEIAIFYTGICLAKTGRKSEALDKYNELVILNSSYAAGLLSEIQRLK